MELRHSFPLNRENPAIKNPSPYLSYTDSLIRLPFGPMERYPMNLVNAPHNFRVIQEPASHSIRSGVPDCTSIHI